MKMLLLVTMLLSATISPTPTPFKAEPPTEPEWSPIPPPLVPLYWNPWYEEIQPNEPLYEACFAVAHGGLGTKFSRKRLTEVYPLTRTFRPVKPIMDAAGGRYRE